MSVIPHLISDHVSVAAHGPDQLRQLGELCVSVELLTRLPTRQCHLLDLDIGEHLLMVRQDIYSYLGGLGLVQTPEFEAIFLHVPLLTEVRSQLLLKLDKTWLDI